MPIYQILQWNDHFENSRSREIEHPAFVIVPNKQHGMGFQRIINSAGGGPLEGVAAFGLWMLILQACSRQIQNDQVKRDGWLTDDGLPTGQPWDAEDLALRWRLPVSFVQQCLNIFCHPKVGWMVCRESADVLPITPAAKGGKVPAKTDPSASAPSGSGTQPPEKPAKTKTPTRSAPTAPPKTDPPSAEKPGTSVAPPADQRPPADHLPTEQNGTERNRAPASPPSPGERQPDSTATAATTPATPKEQRPTAEEVLARKISGVDHSRVIAGIEAGDVIAVARAFRAITSVDREDEWRRDTSELQIGFVVLLLAWKTAKRQAIREASGFRRAREEWASMDEKNRKDIQAWVMGPYKTALEVIEAPATP